MLYYVYKPKTSTSRTNITTEDKNAFKYVPLYGNESTGFHHHMIPVVVFSYSETLESMFVEYSATEMGFLDDYSDELIPSGLNRVSHFERELRHL